MDPRERLSLSSIGWRLWTPWQIDAIGVHAIGGLGLFAGNRNRLMLQEQARTNSAVETVPPVTAAQWAVPVLTCALIILGARQGEQQRSSAGRVDAQTVDPAPADD